MAGEWRIAGASLFLLPIVVVPLVLVDGHFAVGLPVAVTHGVVVAVAPLGLVGRMHLLTGSPVILAEMWVLNCIKKRVTDVVSGIADKGKKRREELCCEICEADHILDECPVFNGPKP